MEFYLPIAGALISLMIGQFIRTKKSEPPPFKKYNLWGGLLNIIFPIVGLLWGVFNEKTKSQSLEKEKKLATNRYDILRAQYDSLLNNSKQIMHYQRGEGSLAYFIFYGLHPVGQGMQATDMVVFTEGKNPITNCLVSITDIDKINTRMQGTYTFKLNDLMPKPTHPSSILPYKFPITDSNLRLHITFNSNSLDFTEYFRIVVTPKNMYTAYKVISWDSNKILKIHYDNGWPYDTTKKEIW